DVYFWADNTDGNRTMLTGGKIVENQWNQVCFVFDTGKREIYINGAKTAGDTFTAEPIRYNFIGETNSLGYLGSIDEVRIYDYARTPAQIAWDYNRGKPISHWTFDEGTGTTAHDLGEGENHGTITGATWKDESECKNGKCLSFDGIDDYLQAGANPILGSTPFSISGWIKAGTHSSYGLAFMVGNASNAQAAWLGWVQTANFGTSNSIGGGFYGRNYGTGIADNDWHHLILTFSGGTSGTVNIYVDGENKVTDTFTPNLTSASVFMGKANTGTSYLYNGLLDEPKIFNYALTNEQVQLEYNNSSAVNFR
ncbi:MAG: LamG domain-containing protein, partial [Candidatus Moranbacteria bacterium]|nr:LamG domain-containing protein [Candidatus Moranbacteria bacterium]